MLKSAPKNIVPPLSKEELMLLQKEYILRFQRQAKSQTSQNKEGSASKPLTGYPREVVKRLLPWIEDLLSQTKKKTSRQSCKLSVATDTEAARQKGMRLYKTTSFRHANEVKERLQARFGGMKREEVKAEEGAAWYYVILNREV